MNNSRILFGIVVALLLVGVVAGVGWTAYNAGIAQGVVESGKLVVPSTDDGVTPNAPYYAALGVYRPFGFYRPWGFGFLGCLVPLFFFLLLFALFRLAFRPRWGGWGGPWMRGGWDPSQGDVPPSVKEWHRKLHQEENQMPSNPTPTQAS